MLSVKMSVAGNNFLLSDDEAFTSGKTELKVSAVCRESNVDGVAFIRKESDGYKYVLANADGSRAKFCGNVTMCLAGYLYDHGLVRTRKFLIHTDSGAKRVTVYGKRKCAKVALEVGKPKFRPIKGNTSGCILFKFLFNGKPFRLRGYPVNVGNDHLVVIVKRKFGITDAQIFEAITLSEYFPDGINVEFVRFCGKKIFVTVFERGCGKTLACGSGAAAVVFVLNKAGYGNGPYFLRFEGGTLSGKLKGKTVIVYGRPEYIGGDKK